MQELIGRNIGHWTVLSAVEEDNPDCQWHWAKCRCGNLKVFPIFELRKNNIALCTTCFPTRVGVGRDLAGKNNPAYTHGFSSTSHPDFWVYISWSNMKARCLKPQDPNFHHYGGRGIKVCDRWLESFENFIEDMGIPQKGLTLDRVDVDGNYCRENCKWVTMKTQVNNQRRTVYYEYNGEKLSETLWAEKLGLPWNKAHWWARKKGIGFLVQNAHIIRQTRRGMSSKEYEALGLEKPNKHANSGCFTSKKVSS